MTQAFTSIEIEEALKQMAHLKSSSPNSYGAYFFQHYWSIIGDDVCNTVLKVLNGKVMTSSLTLPILL